MLSTVGGCNSGNNQARGRGVSHWTEKSGHTASLPRAAPAYIPDMFGAYRGLSIRCLHGMLNSSRDSRKSPSSHPVFRDTIHFSPSPFFPVPFRREDSDESPGQVAFLYVRVQSICGGQRGPGCGWNDAYAEGAALVP